MLIILCLTIAVLHKMETLSPFTSNQPPIPELQLNFFVEFGIDEFRVDHVDKNNLPVNFSFSKNNE